MKIFKDINEINNTLTSAKLIKKRLGGYSISFKKNDISYKISRNQLTKQAISLATTTQTLSDFKDRLAALQTPIDQTNDSLKEKIWNTLTKIKQKIGNRHYKRNDMISKRIEILNQANSKKTCSKELNNNQDYSNESSQTEDEPPSSSEHLKINPPFSPSKQDPLVDKISFALKMPTLEISPDQPKKKIQLPLFSTSILTPPNTLLVTENNMSMKEAIEIARISNIFSNDEIKIINEFPLERPCRISLFREFNLSASFAIS